MLCASLVTGCALAVLRIFLMSSYYDNEEHLYVSGTDLPVTFLAVFASAFVLISLCAFFIKPNKFNSTLPSVTLPVTFSGAFCGFLFTSSTVLLAAYFSRDIFSAQAFSSTGTTISNPKSIKVIFVLMLFLGLLAALYFFKVSSTSVLRVLSEKYTSFCPIIWSMVYLVFSYFDDSVVINDPERELVQLAAIAVMLYFTSESRYQLGISNPRVYFAISLANVIIISVVNIPHVILTALGVLGFTMHTVYSFVQIGILVYIITRISSFTTSKIPTQVIKEG